MKDIDILHSYHKDRKRVFRDGLARRRVVLRGGLGGRGLRGRAHLGGSGGNGPGFGAPCISAMSLSFKFRSHALKLLGEATLIEQLLL